MAKRVLESSSIVDKHPPKGINPQERPPIEDDADAGGFPARLRQALGGRSAATVAKALGYPPQTFDRWVKDRTPKADDAFRIADELGVDPRWLALGHGSPTAGDVVFVPRFDLTPSAGPGRAISEMVYEPAERIAFTREWLRRLNVDPQYAELLIASGDSMIPTINDGDLMLVDRAIRSVETAGIYVVTVGGGVVVKRAFWKRDGSLVLKSDNSLYPEEVIPADELYTVTIEGRVRWAARSM